MKISLQLLVATAAAGLACGAWAQKAGDWLVRGGYGTIAPQVSSGNMTAPSISGTQADVGAASNFMGGLTYLYTDNLSVDLPLALPFKHKLYGAGAIAGTGALGEVKVLPVTVLLQYRFNEPTAAVRPYAGLGLTYARFFGETGSGALTALTNSGGTATRFSVENRWTFTGQLGATVAVDANWFVDAFYSLSPLKTRTTFSTGQTLDINLDPRAYGLTLGYRF